MTNPPGPAISALIPKLTPPRILAYALPRYRQSFPLPQTGAPTPAESGNASEQVSAPGTADKGTGDASAQRLARYVEWNTLVPSPSQLLSSFSSVFRPSGRREVISSKDIESPPPSLSPSPPPPRLVFFGEQHHQPEVLRAQLQTLFALHQHCRDASKPKIYRLHLVLEHFSIEDQPMLTSFSSGDLSPQGLIETYTTKSEEGFELRHYMPLLLLARELGVPIWGGFPPRRWARDMFRQGVEAVKRNEEDWQASTSGSSTMLPRLANWSLVTHLHAAHRSYLSSLMRPDVPPTFPTLPAGSATQPLLSLVKSLSTNQGTSQIYPTWLLNSTAETKGFAPAQALKDTFFAHVTAWLLRGGNVSPSPVDSTKPRNDRREDANVVNVTLCIAGLGHVEYGFGAPERVVHFLRHADLPFPQPQPSNFPPSSKGLEDIVPVIVASKPTDSGLWQGVETCSETEQGSVERRSKSEVEDWKLDPWIRKLADCIVLYEWRDQDDDNDDERRDA